jgi:hypothetical protein
MVSASLIGVVKSSAIELSTCVAGNVFSRPLLLSGIGVKALPPWDQKNDMVPNLICILTAQSAAGISAYTNSYHSRPRRTLSAARRNSVSA